MCITSPRYITFILVSLLLLFHVPVVSAPYFNTPHEFTQPDGSIVTVILNGDEFYMEAETSDGYAVVRDPQTGWICYAELSADGSQLLSTGIPMGYELQTTVQSGGKEKKISADKSIKKQLKIKTDARIKKIKEKQKELFGTDFEFINGLAYPKDTTPTTAAGDSLIQEYQAAEDASDVLPPTKNINTFIGTIKGLVLVFDFSDAPASYTLQQYRDKVNKVNSRYANGNAASLRTYYEDVSRGVFLMDHFVYGIYRAPQTFAYYDSLNYTEGAHQLMSYALNDMEANGFDFSQLTTFSSGEIRALAVMYTGNPAAWAEGMWYHAGGWGGFSADGVHTGRYCTDTANDLNPGTLIHEHGHMAAEWPDTYSYIGGEPGTWDVMGGGYTDLPNPYFLYENGWLDAENIAGNPGLKTMNSTDAHFAYFYYDPAQPTEFYVIRPYVTSLLYCPSIPDQGLTFWRINTQGDNANYPDTDRHVELVHANNTDTNKTSNVCFKEGGLLDHFTSATTPSSNWKFGAKSGQPSGMDVTDISTAGPTMTFMLGTPPAPAPYYPFNGSFNDSSSSGNNAVGYNFAVSPWSTDVFTGTYFNLSQSLRFDGVDDYVVCPAAVSAGSDVTIAFWIKPEKLDDMVFLDKFAADSSGAGWSVQLTQDGHVLFLIGSQSSYTAVMTAGPVCEANRWAHIACTYTGGTAKIFINGAIRMVKKGVTQTPNTTTLNVRMGIASQVSTDRIYQGWMDDVRFYNVCLESGPLNIIDGLNVKPEKGLLAFLKLDETSGTRAEDKSGRGYHGTLNNGLSFENNSVTGPVGNALSFDGVDDYISLPSGMTRRNGGFTAALWAYPTAVKNWARFIDFGNGEYSGNILLSRYQNTNNLVLETYSNSGSGGYVIANGAIELNKWQFYAASVDTSGNVKIYKNGQVVKTGTSAIPPEIYRRNLYIGKSNWSADSYYEGRMDDIRIYNYTLTDAEILSIYQNNRLDGPVPYNGQNDVSPETILQFVPAGNALRHDIYFGTQYNAVGSANTESAEYMGRKQSTEYNPSLLEGFREYFWRVDELMNDGTIQTGPVWRFSTIGNIQRQVWTNLSGVNEISGLTGSADYPDHPTLVAALDTFEIPTDYADSYGTRVHGLLVPQTSGSYRFWISGDNEVELWLGANANPSSASLIAYIHGTWSSPQSFDQYASQQSSLITLQAGQSYYIMALHKEGNGGDHMAVAWQGPDSPTRQIIDSFWLRPPRVNEWPRFESSVLPTQNTAERISLSGAMPAGTVDPDSDTISYSKQSGPDWLGISADGQLSGVPDHGDAGLNTFNIRASDGKGGYDDTILPIYVADRLTGSMGLQDLIGFAQEWLSVNPDSPANLDQIEPVNLVDFSLFSEQWNADIIDGLVASWTLDDTAGLTARDNYADHDGVLTNMTEYNWLPGVSNNALMLDGINDYITVPYTSALNPVTFTVAFWARVDGNTDAFRTAVCSRDVTGGFYSGYNLFAGPSNTWDFWTGAGASSWDVLTGPAVAEGQWTHVIISFEAVSGPDAGGVYTGTKSLYINGVPEASSTTARYVPNSLEPFTLGRINHSQLWYFNGLLDNVRVYSRTLSQEEIENLAFSGLIAHWKLDESLGNIAYDAAPLNPHNGTVYNISDSSWVSGKVGNALDFDGTNDYVVIPYNSTLNPVDFTVAFWARVDGNTSVYRAAVCSRDVTDSFFSGYNLFAGPSNTWDFWTGAASSWDVLNGPAVVDGQWTHIGLTFQATSGPDENGVYTGTKILYINGVPEASSTTARYVPNTLEPFTLGRINHSQLWYFNGPLDDVRIYNQALGDVEIAELAQ